MPLSPNPPQADNGNDRPLRDSPLPLGMALRALREHIGVNQADIADALNSTRVTDSEMRYSQPIVSRLENWERRVVEGDTRYRGPTADELRRIEDHYRIPRGWALRWAGYVDEVHDPADIIRNTPRIRPAVRDVLADMIAREIAEHSRHENPDGHS